MKINDLYDKFRNTTGAVTDTRKELLGKLFFALKGPNFNGNEYARTAISKGARFAIVDEVEYADGKDILYVENVLAALQGLSTYHRNQLGVRIIGITGTNGKTTSKEVLAAILGKHYHCYCTKGNLNNHIGVPLSLLEMTEEHELAVIEMGANKMGDIRELSQISNPDFGYITNIGYAHLEGFGSKGNIAIEKGELFRFVKRKDGVFFLNTSEQEVVTIVGDYHNVISIGERSGDEMKFDLVSSSPKLKIRYGQHELVSTLYGDHNYENVKMACGIALYFKVPMSKIQDALLGYHSDNNRSQQIVKSGLRVFMDAYNANPSSMLSSITSFGTGEVNSKVLVLGDMLELGDESASHHRNLLEFISSSEWMTVILVGKEFFSLAKSFPAFKFFESSAEADLYLDKDFPLGTSFLVKGSRGLALERLSFIQKLQ